ncbi:E3 ubiquitin-protein ligase RNF166 isoform X2 [Tursiops truncatus]|uniref:E3 ubiquitin-protein ligase RNF166 isoform X2 n=1 Tax=Tursiops truncatus TaxID=9739 RepID=UPI003CCF8329
MAMFRSLVASAQQRQPPGGPAGGDSGLEAQYSCPICLEVYHRPVAIGSCGHTTLAQKLLLMEGRAALRPTSALQVLRGVPPAVSAGAIPPVPTVPPALRPQESGQGRPRGEAAFVLQGTLPGLQQEGDTGQDESARCLLREGPGADGQLSQVRPCGAHVPAHPQCRPQQVHLRLPLLWCPQPGSAGVGEALRGQPPQRPQPRGVSHLLSHALGRPELQERQLPAAPAPPAQVLLRHLRGLQHRRGGRLPGRPGPVSLRELKAWPLAQASRLKGHAPPAPAAQACLGRRLEGQVEPHCCKRRGHVPVALSRWPRGAGHWDGVCPLCLKAMMSSLQRGPFRPCRVHRPPH